MTRMHDSFKQFSVDDDKKVRKERLERILEISKQELYKYQKEYEDLNDLIANFEDDLRKLDEWSAFSKLIYFYQRYFLKKKIISDIGVYLFQMDRIHDRINIYENAVYNISSQIKEECS